MKTRRNDKCPCGSGLKYRKCCMDKVVPEKVGKVEITLPSLFEIIKFGLENLDTFGGGKQRFQIKIINLINDDTLLCEFYTDKTNSIDIKNEISSIMAYFNGFFRNDPYENIRFTNYCVRAFDQSNFELLNAISSKASAECIGTGRSVDWMKSTLFQENTNDHRLSVAKHIISEIETTMREVIKDVLFKKYGENWWDLAFDNNFGRKVKSVYFDQFGIETMDGAVLIQHTYIHGLKKIITTYWPDFKHLFNRKVDFEKSMDDLNVIRREEAHNRIITQIHLDSLKAIYAGLLTKISIAYPDILPTYLIDSWRSKVRRILSQTYRRPYGNDDVINEPNVFKKASMVERDTENMIQFIDDLITRLKSLVVPIQKRELHDELILHFVNFKELHLKKLKSVQNLDVQKMLIVSDEITNYQTKMDGFSERFLLSEA